MSEMKHSPFIVFHDDERSEIAIIKDTSGNWIAEVHGVDLARFIVCACNHFKEMRGLLLNTQDAISKIVAYTPETLVLLERDITELLAKLKEVEDE